MFLYRHTIDYVVFRADGKPLLITHLEAINAFLGRIYRRAGGTMVEQPLVSMSMGGKNYDQAVSWPTINDRATYENLNTEENFRRYWPRFLASKYARRPWRERPISPFDIERPASPAEILPH